MAQIVPIPPHVPPRLASWLLPAPSRALPAFSEALPASSGVLPAFSEALSDLSEALLQGRFPITTKLLFAP